MRGVVLYPDLTFLIDGRFGITNGIAFGGFKQRMNVWVWMGLVSCESCLQCYRVRCGR